MAETKPGSPPPSDTGVISAARAAGNNLFSAKRVISQKRFQLGIVPIAFIGGSLFAVAGSIYLYYQITPVTPRASHITAPPTQSIVTPALASSSAVAATLSPVPLVSIPEITPAVGLNEESAISPRATKFKDTSNTTLSIRHHQATDLIDQTLTNAYQAYQNGDYEVAEQRYRNALIQDSMNCDALLGLAAIAQQRGQDNAALQYYQRVLLLDPHNSIALAALVSLAAGEPGGKANSLKQLVAQQPDSAALHFALGNQYADQPNWAEAQHAYFDALAIEPGNAFFAFNLAISLDHLGQRNLAAQYYRLALQLDTTGHSGFTREQAQQRLNQLTRP